jgi:death on curing protein
MLSAEEVVQIHDLILTDEGGLPGHHGVGALEGALARVINRIDYTQMDDVFEIAAMYAVAIARGHVFNDGNKRTALVSALTYLDTEGVAVQRSGQLEDIMVDVAQGLLNEKDLAEILYSLRDPDGQ